MKTATQLIHSIPVDELTGAISVPIYQTSTFVQESPGINKGFEFSRANNPTRKVLEELICNLEEGYAGFAFASGMSAIDAVLKLLKTGDEIMAVEDTYGGIFQIFTHMFERFGIKVNFVDTSNTDKVLATITPNTKIIWLESPTNPTLRISDIKSISKIAKQHNILLVVDNTFSTPLLQQPLTLGADIVIHSASKYLAGHCDVIAGLVVVNAKPLADQIRYNQNISGSILSPFEAWLTIRGIETLYLRLEKQCSNASAIANWLAAHPAVDKVYYPGLATHKNHHIARKQQKNYGGLVSFSLKSDSIKNAIRIVNATKLFKLAESFGGVKSMLDHPATMTHRNIPEEFRKKTGLQDSCIRLSVGIEDADDLINDLKQALDKLNHPAGKQITVLQ
ncbi:trans-sulfuration enzyme family protein [Chitinophaga nivalis]|uniref:PLP-dependent aspartate aminotransferase family protein n=1 Tax=Chitinophaga nivalis TaxID=2991709 RepID=A0ABT3IRQ7_9BACT|nr:PLP-dependent aspartate aminotransferase family protein [Chitinophaga nivalis]MCW3463650.1 PLP-dependent aspartate aminotransferase family protein [Chitinophaga nivalis]MCW3486660.1 PLP-dependent aspartate aminotransferase family protein [Chitinophaga nivalis]